MELSLREYAPAEEPESAFGDPAAERVRARADMAACPVQTWMVPIVDDMDKCLRERFRSRILQEVNDRLANGGLAELLGAEILSSRVAPGDLDLRGASYWRLNRTDFLADVDLAVNLTVRREGVTLPASFSLCLTLWFCTEEGFACEAQDLRRGEDKADRSFWRLDSWLVPVLRKDEIEAGAEHLWENCLPERKDPRDRSAAMLAESLGLTVLHLRLFGKNRTRGMLFFRPGVVSVQEDMKPGETELPVPVPRQVPAGTIVINDAARTESVDLDILHECIHYEWHLLFYRLQKLMSTNPLEIRCRSVQTSGRPPRNPLNYIEHQARAGSLALLLPLSLMRGKVWQLYQEAANSPSRCGCLNHPGFRWERVINRLHDEYRVPRTTARRRLVGLGHVSAKGAVNWVDGRYITPFAFTEEYSPRGTSTLVISRKALADLYHRSREFREMMGRGDFVWADGHVCLNDPQFLRPTADGARLTPWANAHADVCCLRFEKVWLREEDESVWLFGTLNSSDEYLKEYDRFLDRRINLSARERLARRNRLMESLPGSFGAALVYLMENADGGRVTLDELAARAQISTRTLRRYRNETDIGYDPDVAVALCLALHLPPWLSRVMLEKAGFAVKSYGPKGWYGEILDCCFMDTIPEVQAYLKQAGYPELKLQKD